MYLRFHIHKKKLNLLIDFIYDDHKIILFNGKKKLILRFIFYFSI